MRALTLLGLTLLVGCGPGIDPLIGSYTFTMTGTDTNSAPNTDVSMPAGGGTVAITSNALVTGYVITVAQTNTSPCVFDGTAAVQKGADPEITIKPNQTCTLFTPSGTATATLTTAKAVLKLGTTRTADTMTLDVAYSYAGTTAIFNINFAGTGHRTYTSARR